mgnify:CR=1 FL=1
MKKMLFIMCLILILSGCMNIPKEGTVDSEKRVVYITKIGDCQYIKFSVKGYWAYTHKGDCNNPIHIYKEGVESNRVD